MNKLNNLTPKQKALQINLDSSIYGTFAEIGAGQETVRYFFRAGGASGTIAKAMSAYDKEVSDAVYGKGSGRYVSQERLMRMLDYELNLVNERLKDVHLPGRRYFSYANTVATIDFKKQHQGHGWIGIKYQLKENSEYNTIILHVRFHEKEINLQQETLGILGVNLLYAAYYYYENPKILLKSLYDELNSDKLEIDMINFGGQEFKKVDNRLMSLELVKNGMTSAAIFSPEGQNILPADELYKKSIFAVRGSFRPVTNVNIDMFERGLELFFKEQKADVNKTKILFEITFSNLVNTGGLEDQDFLDRADILGKLGYPVLISNFSEYYKLLEYFHRFTKESIGIALGINHLINIFKETYYQNLAGGMLEAFGKLFSGNVKLYLYPYIDPKKGILLNTENVKVEYQTKELYKYFKNNNYFVDIDKFNPEYLRIYGDNVRKSILNDNDWESKVPKEIVQMIKERNLFGYHS